MCVWMDKLIFGHSIIPELTGRNLTVFVPFNPVWSLERSLESSAKNYFGESIYNDKKSIV